MNVGVKSMSSFKLAGVGVMNLNFELELERSKRISQGKYISPHRTSISNVWHQWFVFFICSMDILYCMKKTKFPEVSQSIYRKIFRREWRHFNIYISQILDRWWSSIWTLESSCSVVLFNHSCSSIWVGTILPMGGYISSPAASEIHLMIQSGDDAGCLLFQQNDSTLASNSCHTLCCDQINDMTAHSSEATCILLYYAELGPFSHCWRAEQLCLFLKYEE